MKNVSTIKIIRRISLAAVVMLSLGLAMVPRADASVSSGSVHSASVTATTFGGKDGNESHG